MKKIEYVYVLTHIPTGKKYVGRSRKPKLREKAHRQALRRGKHPCKALQDDYDKFGGELTFEIVSHDVAKRLEVDDEKKMMIKLKTYDGRYGYNTNDPAMRAIRIEHGLPVSIAPWEKRKKKH